MAARALSRAYDEALRPCGLKSTQFSLLVAIGSQATLSISEMAEALGLERTTLTRNLRPLERMGLVAIGAEAYRRSRALTLTEQGRARLDEALPLWQTAQQRLRSALGEEGWRAVGVALDRLLGS